MEPLLYPSGFGSLPGYVFTDILHIPAFVVNYANADAANHAPDENIAHALAAGIPARTSGVPCWLTRARAGGGNGFGA